MWYAYPYTYNRKFAVYKKCANSFPLPMIEKKIRSTAMDPAIELGIWFLRLRILRRLKQRIVAWYRERVLRSGIVILRNRRDKKPDIRLSIRYHPIRDDYFAAAFSMRFLKDIEDGCVVIHTAREGTTQEAVRIFWDDYRRKGKKKAKHAVSSYLEEKKQAGQLQEGIDHLLILASKWGDAGFEEVVLSYLEDYTNATLYNKGFASLKRIFLFMEKDPVLAEYIWKANFGTPEARRQFVENLEISIRHQKAFLEADNLHDLRSHIERKMMARASSDQYDLLPQHLKLRIQRAKSELDAAKKGVRVGLFGRYIDSEQIAIAQHRLDLLWKDADRWIGLHFKNKSRNPHGL